MSNRSAAVLSSVVEAIGDTPLVELRRLGQGLEGRILAKRDYPFVAVISHGNSAERARMMAALGAEVVLVDQLPDSTPGQVSGGDLALVEAKAQAACYVVEPAGAAVLAGQPLSAPGQRIQGGG